jgi:hypothetical protein
VIVIVPDSLTDEINAAIDRELAGRPCDPETRQYVFNRLLAHFDEHGCLPDFSLTAT